MPKMISKSTARSASRSVIGKAAQDCSETGCPLNEVPKSPWKMPPM